jgi:hypothetical protein
MSKSPRDDQEPTVAETIARHVEGAGPAHLEQMRALNAARAA